MVTLVCISMDCMNIPRSAVCTSSAAVHADSLLPFKMVLPVHTCICEILHVECVQTDNKPGLLELRVVRNK